MFVGRFAGYCLRRARQWWRSELWILRSCWLAVSSMNDLRPIDNVHGLIVCHSGAMVKWQDSECPWTNA